MKMTRREARVLLAGALCSVLPACTQNVRYLGPKELELPVDCVWVEVPYAFVCLHGTPYAGRNPGDLRVQAERAAAVSFELIVAPQ